MQTNFSSHASERISKRLNGMVTFTDVDNRVKADTSRLTGKRDWILIKRIPYTEIQDSSVKPDGIARGDSIVALLENGIVETVILRKSWSQSSEFHRILK